jgi:Uma2 family endonuclease
MALYELKSRVTLADLRDHENTLEDGLWIEVDNGEITQVERDMTWLHLFVIQNLYGLINPFVRKNKLGLAFMDGGRYRLEGTPDDIERAYVPDFSFVRADRIPAAFDWSEDFPGAPTLAVEVASPGQVNAKMLKRVSRYLEAGSEEVWLIYPWKTTLWQYRHDADEPIVYRDTDTVDVSLLFPGLTLTLETVFAKPDATEL